MSKKFKSTERFLKPDPKFQSRLAAKFINSLMVKGKKSTAERLFYDALEICKKKVADQEPIDVFTKAIENVKPKIEVRSRRVGGATYQVPMEIKKNRQQALALRWVLEAVRKKKGRGLAVRLAEEFMAAYRREGDAVTTRENVHKMAEANKAFAHFAW